MSVGDPPQVSMRERLAQDYAWTPRQREVLQLIAAGKTNTEIAEMLGLSLAGAKWHVSEILSKLQAESREEAAEYWRRQNGIAPRFARVFRGVAGGMAPKWVAGSLAGVATVAAVGIVLLVVAWQGGEDAPVVPPSIAVASPTVPSTPATASVTPQATVTPRPAGSPPPYAGAHEQAGGRKGASCFYTRAPECGLPPDTNAELPAQNACCVCAVEPAELCR